MSRDFKAHHINQLWREFFSFWENWFGHTHLHFSREKYEKCKNKMKANYIWSCKGRSCGRRDCTKNHLVVWCNTPKERMEIYKSKVPLSKTPSRQWWVDGRLIFRNDSHKSSKIIKRRALKIYKKLFEEKKEKKRQLLKGLRATFDKFQPEFQVKLK